MDQFTDEDLRELISVQFEHCVSIYMPSFRTGSETQQNPIRFKNLISDVEQQLISEGIRPTDAAILLDPARRLLDNETFWKFQAEGMAAFIAPGIFKVYRLPLSFSQFTTVGSSFHLKPLLHALTGDTRFYVLDLNIAGVRLFSGTRNSFFRINSEKIPLSLNETLQFDTMEGQVQFASKPSMISNNKITVFGYGRLTDSRKTHIKMYYDRVNSAVAEFFRNTNAPLALIGVSYLHDLYREANTYPYLLEHGVQLDPQNLTEDEIFQKMWPVVEPLFQSKQIRDTNFYKQLSGERSPVAAHDLKTIVSGALHGRIDTLFITDGRTNVWGKFKDDRQDVEIHTEKKPGDEDLLDKAAINTMLRGGVVYIVKPEEMPDPNPAAAILRY